MARPSKLTEELLKKAEGYISECVDTYDENTKKLNVALPSHAGLARYLSVSRETIYKWGRESKRFSDILDDVLAEQEHRLISKGLAGTYNATIAKLVLGKHGYKESTEQDITTKGDKISEPTKEADKEAQKVTENYEKEMRKLVAKKK